MQWLLQDGVSGWAFTSEKENWVMSWILQEMMNSKPLKICFIQIKNYFFSRCIMQAILNFFMKCCLAVKLVMLIKVIFSVSNIQI